MRIAKSTFLTKLVVLALIIYMATTLLNLRSQIQDNQEQQKALESQIYSQTQTNSRLSDAIENSDDPEVLESVARSRGFVKTGETLFVDVAG